MRHSVARAKSTYDKRTAFEKKRRAVDYCGQSVSKFLKGESATASQPGVNMKKGPGNKVYDDNVSFIISPEVGDVVAVPFCSENKQKKFWLGKVLRKTGETNTVLLAWLEQQPADDCSSYDSYKLKIRVVWEEHILSLLFSINVIQDANNSLCYKLVTQAKDILQTMCDD